MKEMVKSKDNGITEATTIPERKLPNNRITTKITIKTPKIKFSAIVNVVLPINSIRYKNPLM